MTRTSDILAIILYLILIILGFVLEPTEKSDGRLFKIESKEMDTVPLLGLAHTLARHYRVFPHLHEYYLKLRLA